MQSYSLYLHYSITEFQFDWLQTAYNENDEHSLQLH